MLSSSAFCLFRLCLWFYLPCRFPAGVLLLWQPCQPVYMSFCAFFAFRIAVYVCATFHKQLAKAHLKLTVTPLLSPSQ